MQKRNRVSKSQDVWINASHLKYVKWRYTKQYRSGLLRNQKGAGWHSRLISLIHVRKERPHGTLCRGKMVLHTHVSPRLGVFNPRPIRIACNCCDGHALSCGRSFSAYGPLKNNSATLSCGYLNLRDSCDCDLGNCVFLLTLQPVCLLSKCEHRSP